MSRAISTETATPRGKASTKPAIKVDSSFTTSKWPTIDSTQQDIILQILCDLLEPIGHHKKNHIVPSKGKRGQKRNKFDEDKENNEKVHGEQDAIPSTPSILRNITLGYNSTFRHLQETIKSSQPQAMVKGETPTAQSTSDERQEVGKAEAGKENQGHDVETTSQPKEMKLKERSGRPHLSTIFLTALSPSTHIPYTPLPLLAALSSTHHTSLPPTRLIPLPPTSEAKLCAALGIPRVGIIGLFEDAPGAKGLVEYVRENVDVVEVPWVKEVGKGEWLGTKIAFREEWKEG